MSKSIKCIFLTICVFFLLSTMTGCGLFGNYGGSGNKEDGEGYETILTIYDGESVNTCVAEYGEKAKITVIGKSGYYLEGYFDSKENGTKYFNSNGVSLVDWEKTFPTTLYARWKEINGMAQVINVFDNRPVDNDMSGRIYTTIKLNETFVSALKGNFDKKLRVDYSIDIKTGSGYETASPIGMYVKGYDIDGAERYTIFTHTPLVGSFSTFSGSAVIPAADFADGKIYVTIWNTKPQMGSWYYPVYYARNFNVTISFVGD